MANADVVENTRVGYPTHLRWSGYILGFGMGGFFDGILLHQILQWHHLLSNVQLSGVQDIRVQILADGLFHALMYAVTAYGLYRLWRGRADLARQGIDRSLISHFLIGFAAWNVLDIVLFHWILQFHHVRMNVSPVLWDIIWLVAFAGGPILLAWLNNRHGTPGTGGHATAAALALLLAFSGYQAVQPPADASQVVVYFRPNTSSQQLFASLNAVDGRLIWIHRSGQLAAIKLSDPDSAWRLYRHGALFIANSYISGGCLGWFRTA